MTDNKQILSRFIDQCWNVRNKSIAEELLSPTYEHFMPGAAEPTVGPKAYQELVDSFVEAFPDVHFEIEDVFGEGERVCVVWTVTGTHKGTFSGIPPTNNSVLIRGVGVAKIADGKILRIQSMFDNDSFTKQLGAPAEKAAESWKKTARAAP